jgi:sugar diacid utilization regulator
MPVARDGILFAWLVMVESQGHLKASDQILLERAAVHLASEYATQRRVARVSWNARSALARQMVQGSVSEEDLLASADYLGIEWAANRIVAYLEVARECPHIADEEVLARHVAEELGVEVLVTKSMGETILLIEAPAGLRSSVMTARVKAAMSNLMAFLDIRSAFVGISTVAQPQALKRAYDEAKEVALCGKRYSSATTFVITADDLGPARLFIGNSDADVVHRYAHDVLGPMLLDDAGASNLVRTLHCFLDGGRSVREAASRLGVHENTVRLRLAKVHELTGLDVAADLNDQISAQTALLVLRLEGHPTVPGFDPISARQDTEAEQP